MYQRFDLKMYGRRRFSNKKPPGVIRKNCTVVVIPKKKAEEALLMVTARYCWSWWLAISGVNLYAQSQSLCTV